MNLVETAKARSFWIRFLIRQTATKLMNWRVTSAGLAQPLHKPEGNPTLRDWQGARETVSGQIRLVIWQHTPRINFVANPSLSHQRKSPCHILAQDASTASQNPKRWSKMPGVFDKASAEDMLNTELNTQWVLFTSCTERHNLMGSSSQPD